MKNFKLSNFITALIMGLAYPIIKYSISTSNKMVILSDALLITGIIILIFGIIYSMYLRGDFSNSHYMLNKAFKNKNTKQYEKFLADDKQKREDSFNYPLLVSFILIALSFLIAAIFS